MHRGFMTAIYLATALLSWRRILVGLFLLDHLKLLTDSVLANQADANTGYPTTNGAQLLLISPSRLSSTYCRRKINDQRAGLVR